MLPLVQRQGRRQPPVLDRVPKVFFGLQWLYAEARVTCRRKQDLVQAERVFRRPSVGVSAGLDHRMRIEECLGGELRLGWARRQISEDVIEKTRHYSALQTCFCVNLASCEMWHTPHMRKLVWLALTAMLIGCATAHADIIRRGTGVLVSPGGHMLTAAHVVEGCGRLTVILGTFEDEVRPQHPARLIAVSDAFDLAAVKADLPPGRRSFAGALVWPSYHTFIPLPGHQVVVAGFSHAAMIGLAAADMVSSSRGFVRHDAGMLTIKKVVKPESFVLAADIRGGGSGGGVFDPRTGALLGMIYAVATPKMERILLSEGLWREDDYGAPVFAHNLTAIGRFLESAGVPLVPVRTDTDQRAEFPQGHAMAVSYLIRCYR